MSPSMLKTWIIKMSKTSTEILKPISKSNNERKHLGNVKVKLFWSLKHLVKESDSCLLRVLKTKHCFVYRNPIHSRLYIMLGWKMAVSLMKTKQMSLLWTRLFQTLYQQRASSWIYNLIWLYSAIKKVHNFGSTKTSLFTWLQHRKDPCWYTRMKHVLDLSPQAQQHSKWTSD